MEAELKKYKVVSEFSTPAVDAVEASEGVEAVEAQPEIVFEVGQEIEMTEDSAAPLVKEGILELVVEEKNEEDEVPPPPAPAPAPAVEDVPALKKHMGKDIVSERLVVVNEKEYHSLTLADGSVQLLSPAEYEELMK